MRAAGALTVGDAPVIVAAAAHVAVSAEAAGPDRPTGTGAPTTGVLDVGDGEAAVATVPTANHTAATVPSDALSNGPLSWRLGATVPVSCSHSCLSVMVVTPLPG